MQLTDQALDRIAELSRLGLDDASRRTLSDSLQAIFGLIDTLQAVDTTGVEPLLHPLAAHQSVTLRLREDVVTAVDEREALLANAPAQQDGVFLVPRVLE